jgi:SRSO17 transposase
VDADTILELKPSLTQFLGTFDDCMGRRTNRRHLETYVSGQLSDLERKSVEPIADAVGTAPRTLQEFLGMLRWDEEAMRNRLQQRIARDHADPHSVGIIDETSFHKQGKKTACVQKQYCGSRGKLDNCVVSVHLGYAAGNFHTLLDGDLYLPEETWHEDRARCRAAGIPDDVVYRPKWQIALEQVQRALANGIRFGWLTFDEYYGGTPEFLRELEALGQNFVAEIPVSFYGWTQPPEVRYRDHARDKVTMGGQRRKPQLKVKNVRVGQVINVYKHSSLLRNVPWVKYRVKDGEKGPMVVEAKRMPFWIKDEDGLPSHPYQLVVVRPVLHPNEVKFFLSNAPDSTPVEVLLMVAYSRWRIERLFEDTKTELGMDHFEVRHYLSIRRHLILTCVSHLFLAEFRLKHRGKKSRADRMPGAHRNAEARSRLEPRRTLLATLGRVDRRRTPANPKTQRPCAPQPPQADAA